MRNIDRRQLFFSGASAAAGAAKSVSQVTGIYRRALGDFEITALSDGYIEIPDAFWTGINRETLHESLRASFLPLDGKLRTGVTSYLVNTGSRLVLIDSGAANLFGPNAGRFASTLASAGVSPGDVDVVLVTHMHPDHIGALVNGDKAVFTRAAVHICGLDLDYWTSAAKQATAPDFARPWFDTARAVSAAYGDRISLFTGSPTLTPGVTAMPLVGHTPGHTGYLVESRGEQLLVWGDMCGVSPVQFQHPDAGLVFDVDGETGRRTRRRGLDMAATDRLLIASAHLPFPTFGHVDRGGGSYAWVPEEWQYKLAAES